MCDLSSFESYTLRRMGGNEEPQEAADCVKRLSPLTEETCVWAEVHARDDLVGSCRSLQSLENAFNDTR